MMVDTFRCQKRHERLGDEKEEWKNGKVLAEETALSKRYEFIAALKQILFLSLEYCHSTFSCNKVILQSSKMVRISSNFRSRISDNNLAVSVAKHSRHSSLVR